MTCVEAYRNKRYKNALKWNRIHKFYNRLLEYRCNELKNEVKNLKQIIENERENR